MEDQGCDVGLIGLGVMGAQFALNIADHGFSVAVYERDAAKTREFLEKEVGDRAIRAGANLPEFVGLLRRPRSVIMLIPSGAPVDGALGELVPCLEPGDLIVDGGNSHYTDTNARGKGLAEKGLLFLGLGVSGGEHGARRGPSLMPGGSRKAYERMRPILEAVAARVDGEPCVAWLGEGSAGHYVKMVHNGIEYGLMQLLSETYDLMKRGLGMEPAEMAEVYDRWNRSELSSYLLEITARIFRRNDDRNPGMALVEKILDRARQKGTGKWASQDAMELMTPTPNIDVAVMMRNLSGGPAARRAVAEALPRPVKRRPEEGEGFLDHLKNALYVGTAATFAQGMALLGEASSAYGYGLNPEAVARVWRGGCIVRTAFLENIRTAFRVRPDLPNLMADKFVSREIAAREEDLRTTVRIAAELGLPAPGFMASLAYLDACRSAWLPVNLIQAQRDYFGAHTYERIDAEGVFHTAWTEA